MTTATRTPIERVEAFPGNFDAMYRAPRRPIVVRRAIDAWAASRWTPELFADRFSAVDIAATIQLPEEGVVYLQKDKAHRRTLRVPDFVDLMNSGACCYLDQVDLGRFPGLDADVPIDTMIPSGRRFANIWMGARTRSGLHYDPMDNYLIQVFGEKIALLAAPDQRRRLYPFGDNVAKSRIDPEAPDTARFPRVRDVVFHVATLGPGDLLYIPRGWWHFLRAPDRSISINLWHDPALTISEELGAIRDLGPAVWGRVARDFVWHGVCGRPFEQRLYSPPPTGKLLFDVCSMLVRGKSLPS